jgi:TRAP-type mannitol/chloroaromatic compound transport system permease small subunit
MWPYRVQASIDLVLFTIFMLPGMAALLYYGIPYAKVSWQIHELSIYSPTGAPVYPHKTLIPIAGALMVIQCFAEIVRCIICIRDGVWPQRLHDVEEMESAILAEAADRRRIEEEMHVGAAR